MSNPVPEILLRVHLIGGPDDGKSLSRVMHPGDKARLMDAFALDRPGSTNVPIIVEMQADGSIDLRVRIDRNMGEYE